LNFRERGWSVGGTKERREGVMGKTTIFLPSTQTK
jgi:hypothetical protein